MVNAKFNRGNREIFSADYESVETAIQSLVSYCVVGNGGNSLSMLVDGRLHFDGVHIRGTNRTVRVTDFFAETVTDYQLTVKIVPLKVISTVDPAIRSVLQNVADRKVVFRNSVKIPAKS